MSYLNKSYAAAILASLAVGCTEVDDRLGENLLPKNQRMEIEVTSPNGGVHTYLYRNDSLPSSRTGHAYFGRTVDADGVFGARTNSVLVQFLPYGLPYYDAEGYGIEPIIDSMLIVFSLAGVRGDTTQLQRFDVYEVKEGPELLNRDSVYYANFPIEEYRGEKLFEFSHTGRRNVTARLFPTAAGKKYLDSIVYLGWENYEDDSLFLSKFNGLYITPAEGSPAAAAVYSGDLEASGLELYVRNHDTIDVSAIYDTILATFMFTDHDVTGSTGITTEWDNISINMAQFDYTGSVLGTLQAETNDFTDTLPSSPTRPVTYVQSMGGVGTYLRFTDELVEDIRSLKYKIDDGEQVGKDIMINQAMMYIQTEDSSIPALDRSIERIGSYLVPSTVVPIPDYQYLTEASYQSSDATYRLPYNGYLNRSGGYYEFDITSYVQQLAKEREGDPGYMSISPVVFLGPDAYRFGFGESVLKGFGSDTPIRVRITYTIIEG